MSNMQSDVNKLTTDMKQLKGERGFATESVSASLSDLGEEDAMFNTMKT